MCCVHSPIWKWETSFLKAWLLHFTIWHILQLLHIDNCREWSKTACLTYFVMSISLFVANHVNTKLWVAFIKVLMTPEGNIRRVKNKEVSDDSEASLLCCHSWSHDPLSWKQPLPPSPHSHIRAKTLKIKKIRSESEKKSDTKKLRCERKQIKSESEKIKFATEKCEKWEKGDKIE